MQLSSAAGCFSKEYLQSKNITNKRALHKARTKKNFKQNFQKYIFMTAS